MTSSEIPLTAKAVSNAGLTRTRPAPISFACNRDLKFSYTSSADGVDTNLLILLHGRGALTRSPQVYQTERHVQAITRKLLRSSVKALSCLRLLLWPFRVRSSFHYWTIMSGSGGRKQTTWAWVSGDVSYTMRSHLKLPLRRCVESRSQQSRCTSDRCFE